MTCPWHTAASPSQSAASTSSGQRGSEHNMSPGLTGSVSSSFQTLCSCKPATWLCVILTMAAVLSLPRPAPPVVGRMPTLGTNCRMPRSAAAGGHNVLPSLSQRLACRELCRCPAQPGHPLTSPYGWNRACSFSSVTVLGRLPTKMARTCAQWHSSTKHSWQASATLAATLVQEPRTSRTTAEADQSNRHMSRQAGGRREHRILWHSDRLLHPPTAATIWLGTTTHLAGILHLLGFSPCHMHWPATHPAALTMHKPSMQCAQNHSIQQKKTHPCLNSRQATEHDAPPWSPSSAS